MYTNVLAGMYTVGAGISNLWIYLEVSMVTAIKWGTVAVMTSRCIYIILLTFMYRLLQNDVRTVKISLG
jgi:hypothetical protein